jgi:hypothetical protein
LKLLRHDDGGPAAVLEGCVNLFPG